MKYRTRLIEYNATINNPPTPWSPEAKGKARGEAVHGRDTKVRHELSPEVQANRGRSCHSLAVHCTVNFFFIWVPFRMRCRGSGASVSQRFEGRVRHTVVFRRFGRAAKGAV